jgi:hypothetical protein
MQALALALAVAAAPHTVAVLDLGTREGVSRDLARTLSELMVIEVRRVAVGQRVFGAEDIKAMVGFERQKSLLGCEDASCLAELGGALGAQEIVTGTLSILGDEFVLVVRRLDVTRVQVVGETTANVPRAAPAKLQGTVRAAVDEIYGAIAPPAPENHARVWPWILGAGALVAAGGSAWGWVQYANFASVRSQSAVQGTAPRYAAATSAQSSAQIGVPVGIATAAVAAGLIVGMVFTW